MDTKDVPSQSVLPPLRRGKPAAAAEVAMATCTLSTSPNLDLELAVPPGSNEKSTSMKRKIISFVTWGTSKPTIWEESNIWAYQSEVVTGLENEIDES